MKFKNIIRLGLLATTTLVVVATGCKKQDFSNTDPDSITSETVDYRTVLPASMTSTATVIEGTSFKFLQNWMGYWARSGSYQDITEEETYSFTNDFNVGVWNGLYSNATNYDFVVRKANEKGAGFYEAVARIMKSLDMQMLVDIYGNVPYSEAFQGAANRTPAYDNSQNIYDSLFVQLDLAITLLKDPISIDPDKNVGIADNDLIYGGDVTSWIKMANTLKLRMALHAFQVPSFDAAGKIAAIEAEGTGYIGVGESAELNPGYTATKPTPYYRANVKTETGVAAPNGASVRANAFSVGPNAGAPNSLGYYEYNGDPRLDRFYTAPASGVQRGIQYGEIAGTNAGNTGDKLSTIDGIGYLPDGAASRAWILTDFESIFLQAEAANRGYITSGGPTAAKDLTNLGIQRSFIWLGLTAADADAYITGNATYPDVDYDGVSQGPGLPDGGIFTILSQKWFALNGVNTLESWTDWRRTDFQLGDGAGYVEGPPLSVNPNRPAAVGVPIRLFYPQNEYNYNSASVLAQGSVNITQSATPATGRIFWDIN
ncbi:MAG: SusD/RagB family nutrient-binding outer membrane lipoprotein [Ferruginibacter sp.]